MTIPHLNTTQWLAGGASIAVLALAIVSVDQIRPDLFPSSERKAIDSEITEISAPLDQIREADRDETVTAFQDAAPAAESMPPATVLLLSGSIRMKAPVSRLIS